MKNFTLKKYQQAARKLAEARPEHYCAVESIETLLEYFSSNRFPARMEDLLQDAHVPRCWELAPGFIVFPGYSTEAEKKELPKVVLTRG